jgi:ABC-type branched-subunit amino acid transport system ATPase component/ABC-type branched-subunit amino acid transport system permease subunit
VPALAIVVVQLLLFPLSLGQWLYGLVVGGPTALIAVGMALTYRSNRIINFAHADTGTTPVVLVYLLVTVTGWPLWLATGAGVLGAILLGAAIELLVIRRFAGAPRLLLTVATLGLAQVLAAMAILLPRAFDQPRLIAPQLPTFLDARVEIDGVIFNGADLQVALVVPIAVLALGLFLKRSAVGTAIRAAADSTDRVALLGVPVRRIQTVVWVVASLLSFVAIYLRAGQVGLPITAALTFSVLLKALAALLVGRLTDLVTIVTTALALGILEAGILQNAESPLVLDPILGLVIVVALLLRRRPSGRVDIADASSWKAAEEVRPVPPALARRPEVWAVRFGLPALLVVFAVVLPTTLGIERNLKASAVLIYALLGLSIVVLTGWSGQVSLGQIGFFALGAAVGAKATVDWGLDILLALLVAGVVGAVAAVLVGLPALRLRGLYLAVTTFAFSLAITSFFLNRRFGIADWLPDQSSRIEREPILGVLEWDSPTGVYYLVLVALLCSLLALRGVRSSRTGRALLALRDNERGAQAFSIDSARTRLTGFAVSGSIAAVAGCLLVHHQQAIGVQPFAPSENFVIFTMVVVGGVGSPAGAILGALYLQGIRWFLPVEWQLLASGAGVLLILLVAPGGIGGLALQARDRWLRGVADRADLDAPGIRSGRLEPEERMAPIDLTVSAGSNGHVETRHPILAVRDLEVAYSGVQVLFGVSFDVEPGECLALLGTNGAGKSTVLRAIGGLVDIEGGAVVFDGTDVTGHAPHTIAAGGIAQVPGGHGIFPTLTVAENLRVASWLDRGDPEESARRLARAYELFPILQTRAAIDAGDLSGGQQQMLALAMALTAKPKVLLIDELSLGLAPVVVAQLLPLVAAAREQGTAIVLVEQSVHVALQVAQSAVFLEKGEVRYHGPAADLLDRPEVLRSVFLEGAAAGFGNAAGASTAAPAAVVDRTLPPILRTEALTVSFGGIRAVDGVSLAVAPNEAVGIIGPNGAGKTTLFDLISGFLRPDDGQVFLDGGDASGRNPARRAHLGLGRSFQDARLFPSMTVSETIAAACERWVGTRDPLSAALHLPNAYDAERRVAARVDELLDLLQLGRYRSAFVHELSTGTRRIVDLACLLAHRPSVILLDEPSSGIAQRETEALAPLLRGIQEGTGAALVVIEHDMPLLRSVVDRLIAMDQGTVIADGPTAEVLHHPAVVASYLGTTDPVTKQSAATGGPIR